MKCTLLISLLLIVRGSAFPILQHPMSLWGSMRQDSMPPAAPMHQMSMPQAAPIHQMSMPLSVPVHQQSISQTSMRPESIRSQYSQMYRVTPYVRPQLLLTPNRKSVTHMATPYLKWFVPTFKCGKDWFCRAELFAYREFNRAKTVVAVGYSTWHFNQPSAEIPAPTLKRIKETSLAEIIGYTDDLIDVMYSTSQSWLDICPVEPIDVDKAFQEVIKKFVAECSSTTDYVCDKSVTVTSC